MEIIIDIETNSLNPDTIWCICCKVFGKDTTWDFTLHNVYEFQYFIERLDPTTIIGHNLIAFDIPVLKKLIGFNFNCEIVDTLCMSRVLWPDRGGHSLADWSKRLGKESKIEYEDWDHFTPEMLKRCQNDVLITERVFTELLKEIRQNERISA